MALELMNTQVLWSNTGVSNLATLADTTVMWLAGGGTSVTTVSAASQWNKIQLIQPDGLGVDRLIIQYAGNIVDRGGIGALAIASSSMVIGAVGQHYNEASANLVPHAIGVAPSGYVAAAAEWFKGNSLVVIPNDTAIAVQVAVVDTVIGNWGLFPDGVITDGMKIGWNYELTHRVRGVGTGDQTLIERNPGVGGLATVWVAIAISHNFDNTSTLATTKLEGTVRALMYREVTDTREVKTSMTRRGDLKTNVAAF